MQCLQGAAQAVGCYSSNEASGGRRHTNQRPMHRRPAQQAVMWSAAVVSMFECMACGVDWIGLCWDLLVHLLCFPGAVVPLCIATGYACGPLVPCRMQVFNCYSGSLRFLWHAMDCTGDLSFSWAEPVLVGISLGGGCSTAQCGVVAIV